MQVDVHCNPLFLRQQGEGAAAATADGGAGSSESSPGSTGPDAAARGGRQATPGAAERREGGSSCSPLSRAGLAACMQPMPLPPAEQLLAAYGVAGRAGTSSPDAGGLQRALWEVLERHTAEVQVSDGRCGSSSKLILKVCLCTQSA